MSPEENLKKNNINLPKASDPVGSYLSCKKSSNFLFISGQISIDEKNTLIKGKLGKDLTTEEGYEAAKRCALSLIAQAKKFCDGDLNKVKSLIKDIKSNEICEIAAIAPTPTGTDSCIKIPLIFNKLAVSPRLIAPAAHKAVYSPKE